jgi:hypothetical protein
MFRHAYLLKAVKILEMGTSVRNIRSGVSSLNYCKNTTNTTAYSRIHFQTPPLSALFTRRTSLFITRSLGEGGTLGASRNFSRCVVNNARDETKDNTETTSNSSSFSTNKASFPSSSMESPKLYLSFTCK